MTSLGVEKLISVTILTEHNMWDQMVCGSILHPCYLPACPYRFRILLLKTMHIYLWANFILQSQNANRNKLKVTQNCKILFINQFSIVRIRTIDILYTLDSASNYSAIQKLKPWLQTQDIPMKWEDSYVFYFLNRELKH
jgi:hypothetical protein